MTISLPPGEEADRIFFSIGYDRMGVKDPASPNDTIFAGGINHPNMGNHPSIWAVVIALSKGKFEYTADREGSYPEPRMPHNAQRF